MNTKKISLIIVGLIWFGVGVGLSICGIKWLLTLGFGPNMFLFTLLAFVLGSLKGKFVLRKIALKYYRRSEVVQFNKNDIFFGWAKILGIRGFVLIGLMVALGRFLRTSNIDRPILGIIYLAVGIALVYASKIFFEKNSSV